MSLHCLGFHCRTLGLKRPAFANAFGGFLIFFLACHVLYLTLVRFDYGYNMATNVAIGKAWWRLEGGRCGAVFGNGFYFYVDGIRHEREQWNAV